MNSLNAIFCVGLIDLWSTAPEYVLLAIIILLHFRTEVKIDKVMRQVVGHFNERFQQLTTDLDKRFNQIDKRFTEIDKRFTEIDKRFSEIDMRFSEINLTLKDIQSEFKMHDFKINGHEKRLDKIEDRQGENAKSKSA